MMAGNVENSLLDTVAIKFMELAIKDRQRGGYPPVSEEEAAQQIARQAYIMATAMVKESLSVTNKYKLVEVTKA